MFNKIFYTRTRVVLLVLFLFSFFDFAYFPATLSMKNDRNLFFVLAFILMSGFGLYRQPMTVFSKRLNYLFILLFAFAVVNSFSCYYFRHQAPWTTLYHWSPIFLLFLYYPLRRLKLSVLTWERILFTLFILEMIVELVTISFPNLRLFKMTSSDARFQSEMRIRVYGNAILYIGSLFCFNKAIVNEYKINLYWILYIFSLTFMILGGYRIVLLAHFVSVAIMFFWLQLLSLRTIFVLMVGSICLYAVSFIPVVQERIDEIIERGERDNFDNEDYVRLITLNYYYNSYFKSPEELFLGSGMVQRKVMTYGQGQFNEQDYYNLSNYDSTYSFEVSQTSALYHIYPVDWGIIGLSWEAGIPATLVLITIVVMLLLVRPDKRFLYISAWGVFVLCFSLTNSRYFSHHNLIYTVILLVIYDKVLINSKYKLNNENRNTYITIAY